MIYCVVFNWINYNKNEKITIGIREINIDIQYRKCDRCQKDMWKDQIIPDPNILFENHWHNVKK